jgi:branched-chain amino acid transport system permease protein
MCCAALVFFSLWAILGKTRFGMFCRAAASDGQMCEILGVNVLTVFTVIFGVGSFLAGLGGVLATQLSVATLGMDADITVLAFILVIVGGVGSVSGAAVAALIIGLVEAFGALFLENFVLVLIYLVMVIVLLFRPFGLFGKPVF